MEPHTVVKTLTFAYGHRIRGHGGACAHLHGHNARVEIECRGTLDGFGMVADFGEVKRVVQGWIAAHWDHRMVLARGDPLIEVLEERGEPVWVLDGPPTAENLAAQLFSVAKEAGLPVTAVRFWETDRSMAAYQET